MCLPSNDQENVFSHTHQRKTGHRIEIDMDLRMLGSLSTAVHAQFDPFGLVTTISIPSKLDQDLLVLLPRLCEPTQLSRPNEVGLSLETAQAYTQNLV